MTLRDFAGLFEAGGLKTETLGEPDRRIAYISCNSNDVRPDTLFLCKGAHFKSEYLAAAFEKGAVAYVAEKKLDVPGDCILVDDVRRAMALMANYYYGSAALWA